MYHNCCCQGSADASSRRIVILKNSTVAANVINPLFFFFFLPQLVIKNLAASESSIYCQVAEVSRINDQAYFKKKHAATFPWIKHLTWIKGVFLIIEVNLSALELSLCNILFLIHWLIILSKEFNVYKIKSQINQLIHCYY